MHSLLATFTRFAQAWPDVRSRSSLGPTLPWQPLHRAVKIGCTSLAKLAEPGVGVGVGTAGDSETPVTTAFAMAITELAVSTSSASVAQPPAAAGLAKASENFPRAPKMQTLISCVVDPFRTPFEWQPRAAEKSLPAALRRAAAHLRLALEPSSPSRSSAKVVIPSRIPPTYQALPVAAQPPLPSAVRKERSSRRSALTRQAGSVATDPRDAFTVQPAFPSPLLAAAPILAAAHFVSGTTVAAAGVATRAIRTKRTHVRRFRMAPEYHGRRLPCQSPFPSRLHR